MPDDPDKLSPLKGTGEIWDEKLNIRSGVLPVVPLSPSSAPWGIEQIFKGCAAGYPSTRSSCLFTYGGIVGGTVREMFRSTF